MPATGRTKHWKAAALVASLALGAVLGTVYLAFGQDDDAFTAKYRLLRKGTTHEQAVGLLGPADKELHHSSGDQITFWYSPDLMRTIVVTWDASGELSEKMLLKDGTVILSDPPRPWWERALTGIGLR